MRKRDDIACDLSGVQDPEREWSLLNSLAEEIRDHPDGLHLVPSVLALYERFPDADFGVPGGLASAVETFYGEDYVSMVAGSIERKPTELTLFLAERVLNARDSLGLRMRQALLAAVNSPEASAELRNEALAILRRTSG